MRKNPIVFFLFLIVALSSCLKDDTISPATQLKNDTEYIRSYLEQNGLTATMTPEGVWYYLDDTTLSFYPGLSDSVKISYSAQLIPSLAVVDSSSPTVTVLLSSVISGLQIGLSRFPVGSSGKLYIPSGLAFGVTATQHVPANSNLLYNITLVSTSGIRLTSDKSAIASYITSISDSLVNNGISVQEDASGIKYSYDTIIDNGIHPSLSNYIDVDYSVNILNSKTPIIDVKDATLALSDQITAWKIILPRMTIGSKITIYSPSGYAYGNTSPSKNIPANSNLVYQIQLKGVH